MSHANWQELVDQLRGAKYQSGQRLVEFAVGLTDADVADVEARFAFRFPPDLRAFLQTALPCGSGFPNWRAQTDASLRDWLDGPRQGILFDIEHSGFWLRDWGPRPDSLAEACQIASDLIAAAPKLIPIYGHRMIPDEPHLPGNPVFSVHQTDIIYYGFDLADYFRHEFKLPDREPWPERVREIRFWDLDQFQAPYGS
jgi:hypothetical protein